MKKTVRILVLAASLASFSMVGLSPVAMAKPCKAGKHKVMKLFCVKDKSKSGEKKAEKK